MKIALACNQGGHLTEMTFLSEAFEDHDTFYLMYDTFRSSEIDDRKYLIDKIDTSPIRMILSFFTVARILLKERPDVIVSTGAEIAIPAFFIGKLLGCQTVFVESWCRVKTRSTTGRVVYPISDLFLVQWPDLADQYGEKARYEGSIV